MKRGNVFFYLVLCVKIHFVSLCVKRKSYRYKSVEVTVDLFFPLTALLFVCFLSSLLCTLTSTLSLKEWPFLTVHCR